MVFGVQLLGHMLVVAEQIVKQLATSETSGYRVVIDNDLSHNPAISQPQIHVMAGHKLDWPP